MEGKENPESNLRKAARVTKNILKSPFKRRILLIAIAIAAVIILCGAAYESLVDAFSDNVSEYVQGNPVQYNTDDNSIVISDETIDGLIKVIEDMGIDLDDMELTRDDIAKLYAAEVVSSEINRGVPEEAGKYYGRVYIKRLNPDTGELEMLNYEPSLEAFEQMDASQILNYYSMDGDKICIANTNTSTDAEGNTTSTVTINKLSYKDNISQYTVPIEFLLDLCLISQNPGFVLALADKVINETEIVIQVLQNKTTVQTDTTYTYTTETESSTKKMEYDADGNYLSSSITTSDPTTSGPTSTTTTQTQINVSSTIKIQSVKNWIMEVVYTYNKVDSTNTQEPTPETLEDETKPSHQYVYSERETHEDESYTDIYTSTISRKINQSKSYKITTTSEMYQSGVSEGVKDRVDEFIEMLRTPYSIPSSGIKEAAIDNLENGAEMLFQMLQNGQRTQSLERLMRYVLGKATGNDYGVSEFDFNIFDIRDFSSVVGTATLKEFIRYFEGTKEEGEQYIVYLDSGGNRTVGYGVNIEAQGHRFIAKGIDPTTIKEGDKLDKEIIDSIEDEILNEMLSNVRATTSGLDLKDYQIYALVSRQYNCGNISGFTTAYNTYWDESDDEYGVAENESMYEHPLYTNYMSSPIKDNKGNTLAGLVNRRRAEWLLFKTGYSIATKSFVQEGGSIIEWAKIIHEYMEQNSYLYCVYGSNSYEECGQYGDSHGLNTTFEESKTGYHHSCCATYVSWVLQEAGYLTPAEHSNGATTLRNTLISKGFTKINNKSELAAGDILCYDGHIEIYAGDGMIYNAGSGSAIRSASPYSSSLSGLLFGLRAPQ